MLGALTVSDAQEALSKLGSIKPPGSIKAPSLPSLPKVPQAGRQAIIISSRAACDSRSHERQQQQWRRRCSGSGSAVCGSCAGSSRGDAVDVGDETEQDLVD